MTSTLNQPDGVLEPEVEFLSRGELDAYHDEKLADLARHVYGRAPLVTELWDTAGVKPTDIKGRSDFQTKVPFVTKDMIRAYRAEHSLPFGGLECRDRTALNGVFTSSGTTGDATFFAEEWIEGWSPHWIGATRALYAAGVRPGDYILTGSSSMRGPSAQLAQLLGAVPIFVDVYTDGWPKVIEVIKQYRPTYMNLIGLSAVSLLDISRTMDVKELFSSFKAVGFAGEPLGLAMREKFRAWGIDLLTWSTAGDVALCFECPQHDGMHMWEDTGFFEVLDVETGEPVADGGIGELISTSLCNSIAPLVRYRTEDLVRVTRERCACGRTHMRQWPLGRLGDLMMVRGKPVTVSDIWGAVESVPETAAGVFQVVRTASQMDSLTIRVGYSPDTSSALDDMTDRVGKAVWSALGVETNLELMPIDQLLATSATGKIQRVVKA
ncbi:phenylacetate--CoA ligase family protein [Rhodococcus aetherivorans]|uniref:phenylacetate--CoA ligase family protein n=1 Tax=Rhodococcus aetherivorans TaxID=191292 RepID=UPI00163A0F24|nr:phenylacetate--CoA ligase family protein [Rhodococcus aetherivorans]MBC2592350.1 phenylacetate--CoA ligase family protein [Rhodococcus aetherivorans]